MTIYYTDPCVYKKPRYPIELLIQQNMSSQCPETPFNSPAYDQNDGKAFIGSSPCLTTDSLPFSQEESLGSKDSLSLGSQDTSTGSSSSSATGSSQDEESLASSDRSTRSLSTQTSLENMNGSLTHVSPTHSFNSALDLSTGPVHEIGNPFVISPNQEIWTQSQPPSLYLITVPSRTLRKTILDLFQSKSVSMCFGVKQVVGRAEERGQRQDWMLTLKPQQPSTGADTAIKKMLSSMSFVEKSACPIYFVGPTVIRTLWKLKIQQLFHRTAKYGSPPTYRQ